MGAYSSYLRPVQIPQVPNDFYTAAVPVIVLPHSSGPYMVVDFPPR